MTLGIFLTSEPDSAFSHSAVYTIYPAVMVRCPWLSFTHFPFLVAQLYSSTYARTPVNNTEFCLLLAYMPE